jgi:hypothetical protein
MQARYTPASGLSSEDLSIYEKLDQEKEKEQFRLSIIQPSRKQNEIFPIKQEHSLSNRATTTSIAKLPSGDHWLVDDTGLSPLLVVDIPNEDEYLGTISTECREVLSGLLDIRPSHRFGGNNLSKIQNSRWMQKLQLANWEQLLDKSFQPKFQPGKRFIRERLKQLEDISQAKLLGSDQLTEVEAETNERVDQQRADRPTPSPSKTTKQERRLTLEEQQKFKDFFYVSISHGTHGKAIQNMVYRFAEEMPPISSKTTRSRTSILP